MPIQERLDWSDIECLNTSKNDVIEAFKKKFGAKPDHVWLNEAICEEYGFYCYKELGPIDYSKGGSKQQVGAIIAKSTIKNRIPDQEVDATKTIKGMMKNVTTWSSSATAGLKINEGIKLEGIFEFGMEFSISATIGKSDTQDLSQEVSETVHVTVPPNSNLTISLVATETKETLFFTAPIRVIGFFGAQFGKPVGKKDDKHYYWFLPANMCLKKTSGTIKGRIDHAFSMDCDIDIGKPKPLMRGTKVRKPRQPAIA